MKKILIILLIGIGQIIYSQNIDDYKSKTLELYINKDWNNLIILGEEARLKNLSTYEIDYRLAEAYYNTKNYFDSAKTFEFIIKKYKISNDLILEYLYYSYLFSGRKKDALLIAKDFPFHLQKKTQVKKNEFIDYLNVEGGVKLSNKTELGIDNLVYFNGGIGQQFGYRVTLNHAYTNINQNYIDFNYTQNQYYVNAKVQIGKGLSLIPAYHFVNTTEKNHTNLNQNDHTHTSDQIKQNSQILFLALKKQWNRFSISPNATFISVNNSEYEVANKMQYGLNMTYTIKAFHDKFWIGAGGDMVTNNVENNFIWDVKASYSFSSRSYLYLRYMNANTSDFVTEEAMYYYNSVSKIIDNLSITYGYYFNSKFSIYLNYQLENSEDLDYDISFNYNTIIAGIKIDF